MMKVTVLVDNDTLVGINFQGEPALSFYVEEDGKKILFDTGFSDLFLKNAFLGQIPRVLEFENTHSKVVTKLDGDWEEDKLLDDTSLVFDGEEGLVILSGCAHAGICNTVEAAKAITGKSNIQDIVGGFHLLHPTEERMDKTVNYLSQLGLSHITPCHCTDFPSRCRIHQVVPVRPIGSGSVLEYR